MVQGTWVLAGTTGTIAGTVLETGTTTPVADAKVTAVSPSQSASTTSDSGGHFTFISLTPDTYTVSVEKSGYDPASTSGISVFADQRVDLRLSSARTLRTIGRVTSRANSDIVRPGQTSSVYSVNAATADAVKALGGGLSQDSAYSAIISSPGVYVPMSQTGWAQSVYVRGGNYTELAYEYDGVPIQRSFDQYPGGTLSSLGQTEVQVYRGSTPASAQSTGLAGFVNQVIKSGTYPGFGNFDTSAGSPTFYHKLSFEAGGATPSRNFTYYTGFGGYNQSFQYISHYNGADYQSNWGVPYAIVSSNCATANPLGGCYANGTFFPNGYAYGPPTMGAPSNFADREVVGNFHWRLPHKSSDLKDDIQLLVNTSFLQQIYGDSYADWGAQQANITNGTALYNGTLYSGGDVIGVAGLGSYIDKSIYTGPIGVPLTAALANQVQVYTNPKSAVSRAFGASVNPTERDSEDIRAGIFKLQYQKNFSDSAFLRVYGYTFYSDWLNRGIDGSALAFVGTPPLDYDLATHSSGYAATYVNQLSDKNTLNITAGYTRATTVRWNNSWYGTSPPTALLVSSANPTNGICYTAALAATYCGNTAGAGAVARYTLPSAANVPGGLVASAGAPSIAAASGMTCGGAACQYFVTDSGMQGRYNTVLPKFTNLSLNDSWRPTQNLTVDLGLKYDSFTFGLDNSNLQQGPLPSAPSAAARALYTNSYNLWKCLNPITNSISTATAAGVCPAGQSLVNYSTTSASQNTYSAIEPRIGISYTLNPLNVLKFGFGRYVEPSSSAFQQYDAAQSNLASLNQNFLLNGYPNPGRYVYPEDSLSFEATWEHQFKGSDAAFRLTPFYRKTRGEIYNVVLDPKTNFVSGINVGNKRIFGAEFLAKKGSFDRDGFAAQLSYTYTFAQIQYSPFPNGQTLIDNIVNPAVVQYNAYTSFCASNPTNAQCSIKGTPILPTNGSTASACYDSTGANAACGAAGAIANPYWNAPPQQLFSNGAWYVPFNQLPSATAGLNGVASSYVVPHVASLVLNYKHGRFMVTPTLQFSAGGQYGSPLASFGVDPASGCGALASSTSGDPRYPYGTAGGAAYDASTCPGAISAPNFATKAFDNFGAFRQPMSLAGNIQFSYTASNNVTLQLTAANVLNRCFGGSATPWNNAGGVIGCWYSVAPSGAQYTGNFYNPGDQIQPVAAAAYAPVVGYSAGQQVYGIQGNPMQLFFEAKIRL